MCPIFSKLAHSKYFMYLVTMSDFRLFFLYVHHSLEAPVSFFFFFKPISVSVFSSC